MLMMLIRSALWVVTAAASAHDARLGRARWEVTAAAGAHFLVIVVPLMMLMIFDAVSILGRSSRG